MIQNKYLCIGKIYAAHGVKGALKVHPMTDDVERFLRLKEIFLKRDVMMQPFIIESAQLNKRHVILKLKDIDDRTEAELMKSTQLYIDRKEAGRPEEDEYYIEDIKGLAAYDMQNNALGNVADVIQTGAVDVLVIRGEKEYLIPARKQNVLVDIQSGIIKVEPSSGVQSDYV